MKITANDINVDSGCILVCDLDYIKEFNYCKSEIKRLGKTFDIPKGQYKVDYRLPNIFEDEEGVKREDDDICSGRNETLNITSGKLVVIDPCYTIGKDSNGDEIGDEWGDWLNKTNYGHGIPDNKGFIIDNMGGDGCFVVEIELTPIKPIIVANKPNRGDQVYQLRNFIEELIAEGKTDKEIAREINLHLDLVPNLIAIIRKLDKDLTEAYENAAEDDI